MKQGVQMEKIVQEETGKRNEVQRRMKNPLYRFAHDHFESFGNVLALVVLSGIIYFFFTVGLFYSSIIIIVFSLASIVYFLFKVENSPGGSYSGLMIMPIIFLFTIGLILLAFSAG